MKQIRLKSVVPHVFSRCADLKSDVWNQDVTLEKGKTYLVEAHSGRGKSTFCSYLIGYRQDYTGELLFDDTPTTTFSMKQWVDVRRSGISHLFQELRLFPELSARDNVMIKNSLTHHVTASQVNQWFEMLGISDKLDTPIANMSFGQQQRVALMRALAQPFDFLVVDEPISHLDDDNAAVMASLMMEEARRQGAGVIVTSIGKHMDLDYDKVFCL